MNVECRVLKKNKFENNPPKFATANNFVVGVLPQQLTGFH